MNSLSATVGDFYRYVVGVDTHAATHSYAVIEAPNSGLIDQNVFPTSPAGLRRARDWISHRTEGDLDGVLIAAEGTGSYEAFLSDVLQQAGYRVVEAPTPRRARARSKTDTFDVMLSARSGLVMPLTRVRDRRAGGLQSALQSSPAPATSRTQTDCGASTRSPPSFRTHDLGIDAR